MKWYRTGSLVAARDKRHQHLACQSCEGTATLECTPACKLNLTLRPARCAYHTISLLKGPLRGPIRNISAQELRYNALTLIIILEVNSETCVYHQGGINVLALLVVRFSKQCAIAG